MIWSNPSFRLTFEEKLLLKELANGPREDRDCTPHRVLVGEGLARRIDIGMIEITDAGRARISHDIATPTEASHE